MFNPYSNFLVAADFYRKLGDILFYKNQAYDNFSKSIDILLKYFIIRV